MSSEFAIAVIGAALATLGLITFISRRSQVRLDKVYFSSKWKQLQKGLNKPEIWPIAVIKADSLLDEALKKSHFKGKTMGERLVSAQKSLSDNDGVWFAHKLRNNLVHEVDTKLTKKMVQKALISFRQALRDLGAL